MLKIKVFDKIKAFFQKIFNGNKKVLVIVLIIFVLLIFSTFSFGSSGKTSTKNNSNTEGSSICNYNEILENKITNILLSVSKINKADVMILTESTPMVNYLTETETISVTNTSGTTTTTTSKVVYKKDGSSSEPIEVSTTYPKVIGVLIFTNKIDSSTKFSIINVISSVLNIDSSRINILQEN